MPGTWLGTSLPRNLPGTVSQNPAPEPSRNGWFGTCPGTFPEPPGTCPGKPPRNRPGAYIGKDPIAKAVGEKSRKKERNQEANSFLGWHSRGKRKVSYIKELSKATQFQQITCPGHGDRSKIRFANSMVGMGSTSTAMKKQLRSETT